MERTLAGSSAHPAENVVTGTLLLILQPYLNFTDVVYGIADIKGMLEECRE